MDDKLSYFQNLVHRFILNSRTTAFTSNSTPPTFLTLLSVSSGPNIFKGVSNNCSYAGGLRRGWYHRIYFRVVDSAGTVVGGTEEKPELYNTTGIDLGYPGSRVIGSISGYESMFCRGVGDKNDPEMACVRFDESGKVVDPYFMKGSLGKWSDYEMIYQLMVENGQLTAAPVKVGAEDDESGADVDLERRGQKHQLSPSPAPPTSESIPTSSVKENLGKPILDDSKYCILSLE
jgi:hypothetical protein